MTGSLNKTVYRTENRETLSPYQDRPGPHTQNTCHFDTGAAFQTENMQYPADKCLQFIRVQANLVSPAVQEHTKTCDSLTSREDLLGNLVRVSNRLHSRYIVELE